MTQPERVEIQERDVRWDIPRSVWYVLISWGLAVLVLSGLFALWQAREAHEMAVRNAEQDRAMCQLIDRIIGDVEPPAGPQGDRPRQIRADMLAYRGTLGCNQIETETGGG